MSKTRKSAWGGNYAKERFKKISYEFPCTLSNFKLNRELCIAYHWFENYKKYYQILGLGSN